MVLHIRDTILRRIAVGDTGEALFFKVGMSKIFISLSRAGNGL